MISTVYDKLKENVHIAIFTSFLLISYLKLESDVISDYLHPYDTHIALHHIALFNYTIYIISIERAKRV